MQPSNLVRQSRVKDPDLMGIPILNLLNHDMHISSCSFLEETRQDDICNQADQHLDANALLGRERRGGGGGGGIVAVVRNIRSGKQTWQTLQKVTEDSSEGAAGKYPKGLAQKVG